MAPLILHACLEVIPIAIRTLLDAGHASRMKLESVRSLAAVQPPNILAIGLNYRHHTVEGRQRIATTPILFLKASTAVVDPDQSIILPTMAPDEVDCEAELVIVIGTLARKVTEDHALDYVLGENTYLRAMFSHQQETELLPETRTSTRKSACTTTAVFPVQG